MERTTAMTKPPYRVPSMTEIAAIPWNGFTAASTFSGCGGSSLGYRMAGFRILYANEFIPAAQDSYRANAADYTFLDTRDIRTVQPHDILEKIGLAPGELDLFDGSPPCASFSTAGKREAGWGKVKKYSDSEQRTDDLFFEFARLLRGLQPKTFVAENVSGLVKGTAKGYFLEILRELKSCGYKVGCKVLDAQWLGVPQARQRTIFVGVRNDLSAEPAHPKPFPYRYSVRDAIAEVASKAESASDISKYCTGKEWDNLSEGEQSKKYFNLIRVSRDKPSPTICASHGSPGIASVTHPTERRKFSIAEIRRICGFPDDFRLTGTYPQQWERCGRSVPPVMMSHIAATIRDEILRKL
jgi:DNA (cytosine-5)-methyltransferase 1